MAVVYLGQNDLSKKVNNIYIGIDNQSKQVIKGYVGVNGYSKLFYIYGSEININYPIFLSSYVPAIKQFYFNVPKYMMSSSYWEFEADEDEEGNIKGFIQGTQSGIYATNFSKIYLGENSSYLIDNSIYPHGPYFTDEYYNNDGIIDVPTNIETYFLFNKVKNLSHFLNMTDSSTNWYNIKGNLANCNFDNVINMSYAFYGCTGLTERPQSGPNVINMSYAFYNCSHLCGTPACGSKVTDMSYAYYHSYRIPYDDGSGSTLKWSAVCGAAVTNMSHAYAGTYYINKATCGSKVTNMSYAYSDSNVTGTAACGAAVTNMSHAYQNSNIKTAACGSKVTDMSYAYANSTVEGTAAVGATVTNMAYAYYNTKISTAKVVSGVVNMIFAYAHSEVEHPRCPQSATNLYGAYSDCPYLYLHEGDVNMHFHGSDIRNCFRNSTIAGNITIHNKSAKIDNMFLDVNPYVGGNVNLIINKGLSAATSAKKLGLSFADSWTGVYQGTQTSLTYKHGGGSEHVWYTTFRVSVYNTL